MGRFHTKRNILAASLFLLNPSFANAFGIGDVISAAIQVGTKVGGAVIDKAVDSMTDHEAEARKKEAEKEQRDQEILSQVQKAIEEIEAKKDLTPYQREKMKLTIIDVAAQSAAMIAFIDDMQARQVEEKRAATDRLLTPTGMLGTAVDAAAHTPSAVMAQANQLSKSADFKRQIRAGVPSSQTSSDKLIAALERSQAATAVEQRMNSTTSQAKTQIEGQLAPSVAKAEVEKDSMRAKLSGLERQVPESFFSQDFERKIFVEYIDSETETARIRKLLGSQGYKLANSRADADVYYRIEGEYMIKEAKTHNGVAISSGVALSQPQVQPPEAKEQSSFKSVVSNLFGSLGKPAGAAQKPSAQQPYHQSVLVVASRQAGDDKEVRVSARSDFSALHIVAKDLLDKSNSLLYAKMGLSDEAEEEQNDPGVVEKEPTDRKG